MPTQNERNSPTSLTMQPTRAATLNRRQTGNVRQHQRRWRHPLLLPLLVTMCWSLFGLATTAPAKRASSPFPFNVTQALARASETWQRPCGSNLQSTNAEVDSSFNRTASYINIQIQVNMTLLDLENWRYRSGTNSSATTWNDSLRKRQFKFLQPFVKNESTWERRLSVYWAYLKLLRTFHDNYSESTNINREEAVALESVNGANLQLLCFVQEHRTMASQPAIGGKAATANQSATSKGKAPAGQPATSKSRTTAIQPLLPARNKTIDAAHMERMIKFNIQDASEIKIHIWYIMCRLDCFLTNMRQHLGQLIQNGGKRVHKGKPVNMSCQKCPYCSQFNKRCKPLKKKHRQQQQQQQQRQQHPQPNKHNRAGHNGQQKQSKHQQQQQTSRQPKGRKGTRTPNNHARNKQV
ncbi:uncharacterized protein LOC11175941 [Anopheles gambiae]|uniref:uncharacterized protein LOC11175941 n=1 Tax=Anopheles gambiae TaxID=7165 RepID=UPI002AC8AC18|nr:uncharacterized protein LOC11175941 [Anopheles gambiae]